MRSNESKEQSQNLNPRNVLFIVDIVDSPKFCQDFGNSSIKFLYDLRLFFLACQILGATRGVVSKSFFTSFDCSRQISHLSPAQGLAKGRFGALLVGRFQGERLVMILNIF